MIDEEVVRSFDKSRSDYLQAKIIRILNEIDGGRKVVDICREHGVSQATYYQGNAKFRGMEPSGIRKLKYTAQ